MKPLLTGCTMLLSFVMVVQRSEAQTPVLIEQYVNAARIDAALTSGQELIFFEPTTGNLVTGVVVNRDSLHAFVSTDNGATWQKSAYINSTDDEVRSFTVSGDANNPIFSFAKRGTTPSEAPWRRHTTYIAKDDFGWGGGAFSNTLVATEGTETDVSDSYYPSFHISHFDANVRGIVALHGSSQVGGEYYQYYHSLDGGLTWSDKMKVISSAAQDTLENFSVTDLTSNSTPDFEFGPDGFVLMVGRAVIEVTDNFFRLWYITSSDSGQTWGEVKPIPGSEELAIDRNVIDRGYDILLDSDNNFHVFAIGQDADGVWAAHDFKLAGGNWTTTRFVEPQFIDNGLVALESSGLAGDDGPIGEPTLNSDGTLYYTFIDVVDTSGTMPDFRMYTVFSQDGGATWSDRVQTIDDPEFNGEEFAGVARAANDNLHVVYNTVNTDTSGAEPVVTISQYYLQVPVSKIMSPPSQAALVVNELMFDVPQDDGGTSEIEGDANGDGTRSPRGDEFIEIANISDSDVDVGGYQFLQRDLGVVFTFPENTVIAPDEIVVVFGGVGPGGFGSQFDNIQVFAASPGDADAGFVGGTRTQYSNSNDNLIFVNPAQSDTLAEIYWGSAQAKTTKGIKLAPPNTLAGDDISGAIRQSVTRSPDFTGLWAVHTSVAADSSVFSPGTTVPTAPSSVSDNGASAGPESFLLSQNYPNPFNPETTIRFHLPKNARVSLVIYNVVGNRVATLLDNEPFARGSNQVVWHAENFASGIYYYRLSTNTGLKEVKKMALLK
ncbi:MAG: lamin tail domain-containing protein [bacterium]